VKNQKLPKLNSINFELIKMCMAPPKILDLNSKSNLAKRIHTLTFAELSFKLTQELDFSDGEDDVSRVLLMHSRGSKVRKCENPERGDTAT
jgi:hypothetical protein